MLSTGMTRLFAGSELDARAARAFADVLSPLGIFIRVKLVNSSASLWTIFRASIRSFLASYLLVSKSVTMESMLENVRKIFLVSKVSYKSSKRNYTTSSQMEKSNLFDKKPRGNKR